MLKGYVESQFFPKAAIILAGLELRKEMHARDLVVLTYGTSGDGNARYRDTVEAIVRLLKSWKMVSYDTARNRISTVRAEDLSAFDELKDNEWVQEARCAISHYLESVDEVREFRRRRRAL